MTLTKGAKNWFLTVCYNITERPTTEDEQQGGEVTTVFEYDSATAQVERKPEDYSALVAAIVRSRFSADDVEAIVQNYIGSKTAEHEEEWVALQAWRDEAKQMAHNFLA